MSLTKSIFRKYLKENCSSELYLQLSFKYFPNLCFISNLFSNCMTGPDDTGPVISRYVWVKHRGTIGKSMTPHPIISFSIHLVQWNIGKQFGIKHNFTKYLMESCMFAFHQYYFFKLQLCEKDFGRYRHYCVNLFMAKCHWQIK